MSDTEPPQIAELNNIVETKEVSKLRMVAEQIGEYTQDVLDHAKQAGEKVLEKTWYTHSTSLFYLESIAVKSLSLALPSDQRSIGKLIGYGLWYSGAATGLEDFVKTLRTKIHVGDHVDVHIGHFRSLKGLELSDGSEVKPGAKIGVIDFVRNLPSLEEEASLIGFTKQLFRSGESSLKDLAKMCEDNDPRLDGVDYFYGLSHLAGPLAKRLGFDVFDIANPIKRTALKFAGKMIASQTAKKNAEWKKFEKNFRSPREAFISRQKLIDLYGSNQPIETTQQD